MPKKADPLGNLGASRVFYALVPEPATPSALAKALGMTHASVIGHLNGLLRAGVVKRGPKEGRIRFYRIDWRGVASVLFAQSVFSTHRWDVALPKKLPAPADLREMGRVARRLERNGTFLRLLQGYFQAMPWYQRKEPRRTLREELMEFEFDMLKAFERLEEPMGRSNDRGVREFVELMRKYREFYQGWKRPDRALVSAQTLQEELLLAEMCVRNPKLVEDGFKPLARNVLTPSGELLALVGKDMRGRTVVVGFKHGTASPTDVHRLERCAASATKPKRPKPRGVMVAHDITGDAEELLHLCGFEFRKLEQSTLNLSSPNC